MKDLQEPISVEELKGLVIDYNPEVDKPRKNIPAEYVFEDDNPPPTSEGGMEADNAPNTEASIQM